MWRDVVGCGGGKLTALRTRPVAGGWSGGGEMGVGCGGHKIFQRGLFDGERKRVGGGSNSVSRTPITAFSTVKKKEWGTAVVE